MPMPALPTHLREYNNLTRGYHLQATMNKLRCCQWKWVTKDYTELGLWYKLAPSNITIAMYHTWTGTINGLQPWVFCDRKASLSKQSVKYVVGLKFQLATKKFQKRRKASLPPRLSGTSWYSQMSFIQESLTILGTCYPQFKTFWFYETFS